MTKKKKETPKEREARRAGHAAAFQKEVERLSQAERDHAIREVDELEADAAAGSSSSTSESEFESESVSLSREADDPLALSTY
jgi:hypothetical protein